MFRCLLLTALVAVTAAAVAPVTPTTSTGRCPDKPADVVFLLDGSGSQGKQNFQKQLAFINKFISDFDIAPQAVRVGVVQFATSVKEEVALAQNPGSQGRLQHAVSDIKWLNGETNTGAGLNYVRTNVLNHARSNVDKLVVVLTDGVSLKPNITVAEAKLLKHQATVAAIGVGSDVDRAELAAIASDKRHVFTVANFDSLDSIHAQLTDTTCTLCDSGPMDIGFLLDASGSEGLTNFGLQKNFTKDLLSNFNIAPNATRVDMRVFATTAQTYASFTHAHNLEDLLKMVDSISYMNGETNTHIGLDSFRINGFTSHNARYGSRRILVLITDGRALEHDLAVASAAKLKAQGVEIMVVGIGDNVDSAELTELASDKTLVFRPRSFKTLSLIETALLSKICNSRQTLTTTPPPTTTHKTTIMTTTLKPECPDKQADIVFLLDSSDSEGPENFEKQKKFVQDFVRRFVVGPNNVQFAALTFSDKVRLDMGLTSHHTASTVAKAIGGIKYMGSSTNTASALHSATSLLGHSRRHAQGIAIVITDGRSDDPQATKHNADILKKRATVISIGVGYGVDKDELAHMASKPQYVFTVENFDALKTIERQFLTTACGVTSVTNHHG